MKLAVRRLVLAAAPALALGVAGCSIHEQTQKWYTPANGVNADAGDIGLRNVLVVADGERATVLASFANRGPDDQLVQVAIDDVVAEPGGGLDIPANGHATLGPDATSVELDGVDAEPGRVVRVEFRFADAPRTTVEALVLSAEGVYADALPEDPVPLPTVVPDPTVSPAPSGESPEPTGTPAPTASPEPTESPEPTGSTPEPTSSPEPTGAGS